nr:ADP-ribosylation factor-like protein 15 isoform X4 [Danio rerio]XP_021327906.1 ADP-ribosylation factor-like protein 15 isoform X4 [Danio rerio]|eukprot:XP_009303433.1 ADP-ribosylation factor-like protein 15 isoform X4 [Danio rerio]
MYWKPKAFYQDLFYLHNRAWDLQRRKRSTELTLLASRFIQILFLTSERRGVLSQSREKKSRLWMHSINGSVSFHSRLDSGILFSGENSKKLSRNYMDYLCFRTLCCKGPPPPRPEYDVVCIGLTGSGKTSLLSRLCSEATDNIVPTTGFSIKAVPFQNAILNVKELGGADSIKKYWSRYYQGSQGVVFVLDSASSEEDLEVARTELHSALQHPQLCTLPFLILANHQDKPAARSVQEGVNCDGSSVLPRIKVS